MQYPFDLGAHSWPVTTNSAEAQRWFDRGLAWVHGFNHEEAIFCFQQALEADAGCAMAHWGIAYSIGPDYNFHWDKHPFEMKKNSVKVFAKHMASAEKLLDVITKIERGMIEALRARHIPNAELEDFSPHNDAYANAMRLLHRDNPTDLDVLALTVEALMMRTPWQLWDLPTGQPAEGADTVEAVTMLESAFATRPEAWTHPGLLHLYIHLMEMSPHPERALRHGEALSGLAPGAGHLQHMGSHVDVLCGQYADVVRRNEEAWRNDKIYLDLRGPGSFYDTYICHDLHFIIYGAMFLGQLAPALRAAEAIEALLTPEVVAPAAEWMESYFPMRFHALVRFGEWSAIDAAELPEDQELFAYSTAIILYAKGVSAAVQGDVLRARERQSEFRAAADVVPPERVLFNNYCVDILKIADAMLEGEILYREGRFEEAFAELRRAVDLDDTLPYEEPWGWMQPARHALGALLLEQGQVAEAEAVYRADLGLDPALARACQNPANVWSLRGLYDCLMQQDRGAEAALLKPQLDLALARADRAVTHSCFCAGRSAAA